VRKLLDRLYDYAAYVAALFMIGTLLSVLAGVLDRYVGWGIRGTDMYAGYCMAGAGFLALAHTLKRGEHIRVTLILAHLGPNAHRWMERWAMGAAALLAILFAVFSVRLVMQSLEFHDISTGNDATPLWIPQVAMAMGTVILAIAAIDEFIIEWRGRVAAQHTEALRHE
jgi:TRAP-type C4-dicarboxylate transport system permease small subunit